MNTRVKTVLTIVAIIGALWWTYPSECRFTTHAPAYCED